MNLIILENHDQLDTNLYRLADKRAEHIIEILKRKPGETLEVGLLNGPSGQATIDTIENGAVTLRCQFASQPVASHVITDIICALPRPQTLKKALHSAAAMGARNLYLIRANRVEKSYFDSPLLNEENYREYLLEGLSQGKRTIIPQVSIHQKFKPFFEDFLPVQPGYETSIRLVPEPANSPRFFSIAIPSGQPVILAIGPEGGWVPFEIELMMQHGFQPVNLGPWILRVENALVAALSQLELVRTIHNNGRPIDKPEDFR